MSIFISIAAYRDPELIPTIEDCLRRARYPADLRFGICWQHGEGEPPPPRLDGGRMRVIDVPWRESRGACWARAEVMKLWDGEEHFLQLDSHHRFAEDWDSVLLDQMERSGSAKPVLTTYAAGYDPAAPTPGAASATRMKFDRFTQEGIPLFQSCVFPGWQAGAGPVRARFASAHLLFAPGSFVAEIPYDPDLYFIGEEITLAIRAFTHGYDLFHPGAHVVWHEYGRPLRPKHWDDHLPGSGIETTWHARDVASLEKVRRFLCRPHIGPYGCGRARSFGDYQTYAGVNFRRRFACRAARLGEEPPLPPSPCNPSQAGRTWTVRLALDQEKLLPEALDNPMFWYVGFHDADGVEIARHDASRGEMAGSLARDGRSIILERCFTSPRPPASWTIWPTDRRGRWLDRMGGPIALGEDRSPLITVEC